MRVQEFSPSSCSKMTEERSKLFNGDNGIKSELTLSPTNSPTSPNVTPTCDSENSNKAFSGGGSLKFYKDGKFILELSHRIEGERTCWIPVSRKTYWPAVGTPKQECSTSLSDDNSSVQSSPWQRDHCWKQSTPVQNVGKEMEFVMKRTRSHRRFRHTPKSVRLKRRRPYDTNIIVWSDKPASKPVNNRPVLCGINMVIQHLWERVARADPGIVSPRKRILREMERVTLEDQNSSKRQRARPGPELPKAPSSHSITSILAREDEPSFLRSLLRPSTPSEAQLPMSVHHGPPLHHIYPYPSPSYGSSYYAQLPGYRGMGPGVWGMQQHHFQLSTARNTYPSNTTPPLPWSLPYQPRGDCSSGDMPLNLSKDAG